MIFKRTKQKKNYKKDYGFKPTPVDEHKNLDDYTKKEAKLMFEWYLDDLPKRTQYLFDYINRFTDMPLEYNFETFKKVIDWFSTVIETRKLSKKEFAKEKEKIPKDWHEFLYDWDFTDDSWLLIAAIAGYLGMVMLEEFPGSYWKLDTAKTSVNYNRAIIGKQGKAGLGVRNIMEVIAYKIVKGKDLNLDQAINSWRDDYADSKSEDKEGK
ncbi:MAG: hypothetical protein ACLUVC_13305 [Longibaculum sp.]